MKEFSGYFTKTKEHQRDLNACDEQNGLKSKHFALLLHLYIYVKYTQ